MTLKRHWFDLIAAGAKNSEYRSITPHRQSRLVHDYKMDPAGFRRYDAIEMRNGYRADSPVILIEHNRTEYSLTKLEPKHLHGESKNLPVFAIRLGQILEISNYKYPPSYRLDDCKIIDDYQNGVRLFEIAYNKHGNGKQIDIKSYHINELRKDVRHVRRALLTIAEAHTDMESVIIQPQARDLDYVVWPTTSRGISPRTQRVINLEELRTALKYRI